MAVKRQGNHELPGEVRHGPLRSAEYLSSIHNKLCDSNRPDMCPFDLPCQSLQTLRVIFFTLTATFTKFLQSSTTAGELLSLVDQAVRDYIKIRCPSFETEDCPI